MRERVRIHMREMAAHVFPPEYDPFAWIYDQHWGKGFSQRVQPVLEQLLLPRMPAKGRTLGLCCRTGQIAGWLAGRGFRVTGVDASAEMLLCARRNAPTVEFLQADARDLHVRGECDAAISTFNSLAHTPSPEEMPATFCNVRAALRSGAPFLFDISSEEAYRTRWRGSYAIVGPDHACVVRPSYEASKHRARNNITVFYRNGGWERVDPDDHPALLFRAGAALLFAGGRCPRHRYS